MTTDVTDEVCGGTVEESVGGVVSGVVSGVAERSAEESVAGLVGGSEEASLADTFGRSGVAAHPEAGGRRGRR